MLSSPSSSTSRACGIRLTRSVRVRDARGGRHAGATAASAPGCSRARGGRRCARYRSSIARKYPGPPESRSPRAHQRRLAASPAQLGARIVDNSHRSRPCARSRRRISPAPTQACRRAGRRRVGSTRTGRQSTSERTRWGWLAVSSMTGSADSDRRRQTRTRSRRHRAPRRVRRSKTASRDGRGSAPRRSFRVPRRSVKIKRLNEANRRRWPATVGSSHSRSIGKARGARKGDRGRRPRRPGTRGGSRCPCAYSVSGLAAMP